MIACNIPLNSAVKAVVNVIFDEHTERHTTVLIWDVVFGAALAFLSLVRMGKMSACYLNVVLFHLCVKWWSDRFDLHRQGGTGSQ